MKKMYRSLSLLLFTAIVCLFAPQAAKACVQTHDSVYTRVHYETPGNTDVSITLTNLRLATGTPNEFCSCGITHVTAIFQQILYVAFVDSGTTNPYPGFDVWDASANASNAWNTVLQTNDWNAFVSHVNTNGLTFNHSVELIIRARLLPGYTYTILDSMLYLTQLGTDAYDNQNQVLGNMHQDISGIQGPHILIPEGPGSTYFANLDAALMTSRAEPQAAFSLTATPVPARDHLDVAIHNPLDAIRSLEIFDATGKRMFLDEGLRSPQARIDVSQLPTGVYFLKVHTATGVLTKKFVKSA